MKEIKSTDPLFLPLEKSGPTKVTRSWILLDEEAQSEIRKIAEDLFDFGEAIEARKKPPGEVSWGNMISSWAEQILDLLE